MAADWIPMRLDLYEDPAVIQMAERLEVREETIVGYLHRVWSWVSRQCHDDVTFVSLSCLGKVTNLPGFPEEMLRVGWLEVDEKTGFVVIPKWDRWLSQSAKTRVLASRRKAKERAKKSVTQVSRGCHATGVTSFSSLSYSNLRDLDLGEELKNLSSERFSSAWDLWIEYRAQDLRKPLSRRMAQQTIRKMAGWGEARSIAAIEHTIAQGWQGLREPEENGRPAKGPSPVDQII